VKCTKPLLVVFAKSQKRSNQCRADDYFHSLHTEIKCNKQKFCYSLVYLRFTYNILQVQVKKYSLDLIIFFDSIYSKKEAPKKKRFTSTETMRM